MEMEDEKLLPLGEPTLRFPAPQAPASARKTSEPPPNLPGMPTPARQQWGVVISIVIIVLMIVVGAFYSWGKRISEEQKPPGTTTEQ